MTNNAPTTKPPDKPLTQTPEKLHFRTWTEGPLIFEVYREIDPHGEHGSRDDLTPARRAAFTRGDWSYMGVVCDVRVKTPTNWAIPHQVGRASIWNVESDSGEKYFTQLEGEMIEEAKEDTRLTIAALKQCTNRL